MTEKSLETRKEEMDGEKKAYTPPTLSVYGKLTDLTAGGSQQGPETGSMTGTHMP